jgi:transposase
MEAVHHNMPLTVQFMSKNKIAAVSHPCYSPDINQCNFSFPKIKLKLKRNKFNNVLEFWQNLQQVHNSITK